jgi:hypothetical protein
MSPEEKAKILRFHELFLPSAFAKRAALPANRRFVHYTSAENAISIIKSKRLWMRNARVMNDYRELQEGHDTINKLFKEADRRTRFAAALDSCYPGMTAETFARFDEWWRNLNMDTYITSISEHDPSEDRHGRLSMWRAYGGASSKIALVLKMPDPFAATPLHVNFMPALYWTEEEFGSEIDRVISNVTNNKDFLPSYTRAEAINAVALSLIILVISVKHVAFSEEKEWRLAHLPSIVPSSFLEKTVETINGIPQIVHKIPLVNNDAEGITQVSIYEVLKKVIIGPSPYPRTMYDAFIELFKAEGFPPALCPIVDASSVPLRT